MKPLCALLLMLSIAMPVAAQESATAPVHEPRVGIGVDPLQLIGDQFLATFAALSSSSSSSSSIMDRYRGATLYVPVNVLPFLRIEASLGYFGYSAASSTTSSITGQPKSSSDSRSSSMTNAGLSAFYRLPGMGNLGFYAGPRLGLSVLSMTRDSTVPAWDTGADTRTVSESSQINWTMGLAAGAEYFFVPWFSLGADVEGGYQIFGTPKYTTTVTPAPPPNPTPGPSVTTTSSMSTGFTGASVRLRYYFL